ncbi:outer membrane protein assembly factor BamE [Ferrimonas senticii]|uniref:outer membrane protein assembly factor BamE n=1 Tax=Ferrimonas senticii TaxID=394566 RepID=UPI00040C5FC1|nr:outer membrane protein assembly factor BamE [Ferrimonas senticii]
MKQFRNLMIAATVAAGLSGCAQLEWLVYKIDVPQGNFIEQNQVDKLRIAMTKEQVEYVLGRPVLRDSFADDTWYYVYQFKSGRTDEITEKQLIVKFANEQVISVTGDYPLSDQFNTPLQSAN